MGLEHFDSGEVEITHWGSTKDLASAMKIFRENDIFVARRNVYLKRASMVRFAGLTSGDSIVLRAKRAEDAGLIPFVLNTDRFWDYADQHADGTMSKRLSPKTMADYEFFMPADEDKAKFTELLWMFHRAKTAYGQLIAKTDELVKSEFIERFGDFKTNPKGWPVLSFEQFATIDGNMTTDYARYADAPHIGIDSIE